ncbi:NAD(P)-binding protein [Aaosphaeria arxii CBS 175.79]|uniref:NAD(P)-binding protein n=1 Tax=Aaosphaeria arxii CBS 175.79 TaxID=1450172 RepID=A0A6A5XRK9_9PLEO|nr:NAD(P)-binding protein [Aaosphaeria arxii CBS 175.79]KAF2015381.1 NAD(P)-binding protein [Aaosphaeria arxii CBS 175.79]
MSGQQTRQWVLANPPKADPVLDGPNATFSLTTTTLPKLGADEVLVKVLYLSNDPAQRGWIQDGMDPERLYTEPVVKGDVMRSYAVGEVVESNSEALKVGQLVTGSAGWTEYAVLNAKEVRAVQADEKSGIRPTHFVGALGGTGLTAYYGLVDIAEAKAEDVVVVSGAAGATGSMVVQIAKHIVGAKRVIGIAGGEKKCRWVESLGADVCVDYKAADFKEQLKKATDGFVDVYFDNVGGEILDLMLTRVKRFGRIAACGAVSTYNSFGEGGVKNWFEIIVNRITVKGFIVTDAIMSGKTGPMIQNIVQKIKEGKIKIGEDSETVVPTAFEDIPKTWTLLFSGGNTGKLVTQIK